MYLNRIMTPRVKNDPVKRDILANWMTSQKAMSKGPLM